MTPYIQQQLKKLCDNPNWYDDMLISWDKNPRNPRSKPNRYNHNRYNITTMKKKDIIYIPGQDKWSEHFPTPGKLRPSNFGHIFGDTQSQFNKLLRTQQKLRNKKK